MQQWQDTHPGVDTVRTPFDRTNAHQALSHTARRQLVEAKNWKKSPSGHVTPTTPRHE